MKSAIVYLIILIKFSSFVFSQKDSYSNYHSPLEIPLILSANFGEIRPNHFHMGIDFKTKGVEGQKILSIEEGYVSRIKISPYGYGKVIYVNHPNGITSVYAHCSAFVPKIDSIIKAYQTKLQNFEIEFFPTTTEIILKKGEHFAYSGNTGSSTAPHLHFELRDTKTETALNPLKFGFQIIDNIPPEIKGMKIYSVTNKGYLIKGKSKTIAVKKGLYGYYIGGNVTAITSDFCTETGGLGFGFETTDHYNQSANPLGIYESYLVVDNDTIFRQKMDSVSFETTKYINSHIDYDENHISKRKFQKSFRTKDNKLTIYNEKQLGVVKVKPNDSLKVVYTCLDINKNKSELKFNVKVSPGLINILAPLNYANYLFPDSSFTYQNKTTKIEIPEGCVYEPVLKNIKKPDPIYINSSSTPIQSPIKITVSLVGNNLPPEKYYITSNSNYLSTKYSNGFLSAESKSFGEYTVKIDTVKPIIASLNFLKTDTICKKPLLTFKISDSKTPITDYDLYIDGVWVVLEYESKGAYYFYRKTIPSSGKHVLKIIAKDACKNETTWEQEMYLE